MVMNSYVWLCMVIIGYQWLSMVMYGYQWFMIYIRKNYKSDEFSHNHFDEIWPKTMYYSTGYFVQILSNFKNS